MKTAVIKKSTIAFITFVLALAFALVGCGGFTANPEEPFWAAGRFPAVSSRARISTRKPSMPWKIGASTAS